MGWHLASGFSFFSWLLITFFNFCICCPFKWFILIYFYLYKDRHHLPFRIFWLSHQCSVVFMESLCIHFPLTTFLSSFLCLDTLMTFFLEKKMGKKKSKPSVTLRPTTRPLIPTSHPHEFVCFPFTLTIFGSVFVKNNNKRN